MHVNDCLSLEGNCNIANEETEEVGVDLTVKNLNQNHHLYKVDATIADLFVYCEKFALNSDKIYCEFNFCMENNIFNLFITHSYQRLIECK